MLPESFISEIILSRQVSLLKSFQHKNVVRLLDVLDIGILTDQGNILDNWFVVTGT